MKTPSAKGQPTNRLIGEKSPYLLQHAHNPVDWYPWGEEAFTRAGDEDRPIFLSIGYSTCHWCHVMERESFEDPEVAQRMNEAFVCIKVDREERPDIDHTYMAVCQLLTGSGGWPLTVIMTPDRKPFFAGTYFPRESRFGRMGMLELIPKIADTWNTRKTEASSAAEEIITTLRDLMSTTPGRTTGEAVAEAAFQDLSRQHDRQHGGFGMAPKFPVPGNIIFLLRHWRWTGSEEALRMAERTLQAMRKGGIYDHIGFGFHRYSTDGKWLLPHFEKMLYDQALLATAYTEAFQATGRDEYGQTAEEIFTYVLRDMTDPEGGFYSAEDADSEGVEGKFYTWTASEIDDILDRSESLAVREVFRVRDEGNYKTETGEPAEGNILHQVESLTEAAGRLGVTEESLADTIARARTKLFEARDRRVRPGRDDKILTDWNGLMIAALARGASALREPRYTRAAEEAAGFCLHRLRDKEGRLYHRYRDGEVAVPGHLDDYAFLTWGLTELYQATLRPIYLKEALKLAEETLALFWDETGGGLHFTPKGSEDLPFRYKSGTDGATLSGNAVTAMNLLHLARLTGNPRFEEKAAEIGRTFSGEVKHHPSAYATLATALATARNSSIEVVIVGDPDAEDTLEMISRLRSVYYPNMAVVFVPAADRQPIVELAPYVRDMKALEGRATAYVCRDYICRSPATDVEVMMEAIGSLEGAGT